MSTAIIEVQSAVAEFDKVEAGLAELEKQYGGVVYDVTTGKGMDEAKAARLAIREPRYEIERVRKAAKAPLLKLGKELDARAEAITAKVLAIEEPIDLQIKSEEKRKEDEKQAKIAAEQKRVTEVQSRIESIRRWPSDAAGKTSELVEQMIRSAEDYAVTDDFFAEFSQTARDALVASTSALKGIHTERLNYEAEQVRLIAERAELERLRTEQAERERIERERIAEEERKAKAEREAESVRQAEALRREREENARIANERQAELDRQEREARAARDAEERRIAAERAELERQQAEIRRQQEEEASRRAEQARIAAVKRPTMKEIIAVLVAHYSVPEAKVSEWLAALKVAA